MSRALNLLEHLALEDVALFRCDVRMPKPIVFRCFFVKLSGNDFCCKRLVTILVPEHELVIIDDLRQPIRSEFNQEWKERR